GHNKLNAHVSWNSTGERDDEKVLGRFRCHPKSAVTVTNSPQHLVAGDKKVTYEILVHQKNVA
ncbi:5873_t:CDS:2, partial [Funneliformis geosporum]